WIGVWLQSGPAGGLVIFVRAGGLGWLLTWLAVAGVAVMIAMLPAAAGLQRMRWRGPLIAAGMLPLLPVTLAYARVDHAWLGNPWLRALLLGALAGGFAWGLPGTTHARIRAAAGWVAVLMPHSFALWLVMDGSRRFYLLDQGVALVLGDAAVFPGALAVGLWI